MHQDLVIRAQAGDREAFAVLVASSVDRLFNIARLILRSSDLAEDAVHETLLRAWTTIPGLRGPESFDAWIQERLVRACYRAARRERGRRAIDISSISSVGDLRWDGDPSTARRDDLERGFARLAPDQRAVLVVYHFLELRDVEAEKVLGIRRGTLASRLTGATTALQARAEAHRDRGGSGTGGQLFPAPEAIDRALREWFRTDARDRAPSSLLDAVATAMRRTPTRTTWTTGFRRLTTGGRPSRREVLRLSVLLVLGSLLVVGGGLVVSQGPARIPVGWLAYVHAGDIYLADAAGDGSRRIVHADGVTFLKVAWSPDGGRLAAEGDSGTILIDPVTQSARFVGGTSPAWSASGQQLAVVDYVPSGSRVRIVDADTLSTERTYPFLAAGDLAWSPNGRWIAASGRCSGPSCQPDSSEETNALIRIDVGTGEVVQLDAPSGQCGRTREPAWSPDSRHLAFVRWGDACWRGSGAAGADVVVADADGSNRRQLNPLTGHGDQPAWSPDGSWISWRDTDIAGSGRRATTASNGISLEHPDGTGERLIAGAGTIAYTWGPGSDRVWLAVQATGASTAILWEAPLTGAPGAVNVSLDSAFADYGQGGSSFAWQPLARGRTAAALPSAALASPVSPAELTGVTPAPGPTANPGQRWPTLRTMGPDGCSIANASTDSADVRPIASFCDATGGWSGSWSPTGSAFAVAVDGKLRIYGADGHENQIDQPPGIDGLSWSPDGTWLAVSAGPSAWVLRPDGSDVRTIPGMPSWSPDGRTMAISRTDGVLLVGPAKGPDLTAIGTIPGPATWSPDGSRFGFIRDGNLWTVAIDGSDMRNVTALPMGGASWATWSPDGAWIAVSAPLGVWIVRPSGEGKTWTEFGRHAAVGTLLWSPDSTRLAVETYAETPDSGQISTVYLLEPDGSPIVRIDGAAGPNWSPDGRYLVVANEVPGGGDSARSSVMNRDGTGRVDLPAIGLDPRSFVWAR